jgi:hypothetical protein
MNCEHLAMRDGRWVFLDFKGKGNKTRSVAVPLWVKQEKIDRARVKMEQIKPGSTQPRGKKKTVDL